ncbi:hypothetical protein Lesp02_04210 [Lentzea sp. NBRC 105346]|uniref:SAM-dependent methyltransferase n=1 Tax=Lentzea sp. NBRC 105346 TaxID=3032205 RepID=UPI0024A3F06D|nr:SAM-dependent methyltransferase [Lentzea sp. NBRC 105346]GLZ28231.1 hypothetical protein Lesp02_04210 [Lentzea sp. NBRC 105346]
MAQQSNPNPDLTKVNPARVHDWFLGGTLNTPIDRAAGKRIDNALPELRSMVQANRVFLRHAVNYMLDQGVRQFLELGSGLPTARHVHHVIREAQLDAAVVYIDWDPAVVTAGQAAVRGTDRAALVQADLRDPRAVLDHPFTRQLINFAEPVGLLMIGILHTIPDDAHPDQVIALYRQELCSHSHLALSHPTQHGAPTEPPLHAEETYLAQVDVLGHITTRSHATLDSWLEGLTLIPPGLAPMSDWLQPSRGDTSEPVSAPLDTLAAIGYEP